MSDYIKDQAASAAAPTATGENKDNSLKVVIIVLILILAFPVVTFAGIAAVGLVFVDHASEIFSEIATEFGEDDENDDDSYAGELNEGQKETVRNLTVLTVNSLITEASVSVKDCTNLSYIAQLDDEGNDLSKICSGEEISLGSTYYAYKGVHSGGEYRLSVKNGETCSVFTFNDDLDLLKDYSVSSVCRDNIEMKSYKLVDTGEQASPNEDDEEDYIDDDDGVNVDINVSVPKSST